MSSPTHPTSSDVDEEYDFPSANIFNYTSTLPNYFPVTLENISSDFLENSKNDEIPPVFLPFYNNPRFHHLKDAETPVQSSILVSPSSSVGSSSLVKSIKPPPDYLFDGSIFTELDNSLWIITRLLGSKPVPEESNASDAHLWK
nr:hypothetical protein [Tanacetum cinerariifolium]